MKKLFLFFLFLTGFFLNNLSFLPFSFAQTNETMTITTYYPAPYGVYNELRSKRMAIGDNYYDGAQYCWSPATCANPSIATSVNLVVQGNVGIGTVTPSEKLDIAGNIRSNSAFSVSYEGCGAAACYPTVTFPVAFSVAPVVVCSAGPNGNPTWDPLLCVVRSVSTGSAGLTVTSADGGQMVTGTKTIYVIAMAP